MDSRSGARCKAPARLRGRQLSADLEPGRQIHHLLVDARQHLGFSEACGWDRLRGVADAWPKVSEARGLVSGWPIASLQRVHESRRYGRLDLLGWQGDALLSSPSNEAAARFSPDGRFIAFEADDGGVSHVYVQPFPGPGPRTAISAEEGGRPVWINGGRLLFLSSGRMMVVDVQTHPDLRVGQARPLNGRRDVQAASCLRLMDVGF